MKENQNAAKFTLTCNCYIWGKSLFRSGDMLLSLNPFDFNDFYSKLVYINVF